MDATYLPYALLAMGAYARARLAADAGRDHGTECGPERRRRGDL